MSVIMCVISFNVYTVLSDSIRGSHAVGESLKKINLLHDTRINVIGASGDVRDFIIYKNDSYLDKYDSASKAINGVLNPAQLQLLLTNHSQQAAQLNDYIKREYAYLDNVIFLVKATPPQSKSAIDLTSIQHNYFLDNIRILIDRLYIDETKKFNQLNEQQQQSINNAIAILFTGLVLFLALLIVFYLMVSKNTSMRNKVEEDLLTAKQYAEEGSNTKTQFLSTVSHGIRYPLNGVVGNTSLLNQTDLSDEQKKYAQNIMRSSITLLSIVNDILDFSKIESGALILENLPFVLNHCIEEVFSLTGPADKDIKTSYHIDGKLPQLIVGDMGRLWQVLINIIANTLTAFRKGSLSLDVEVVKEDGNELVILFKITGTGDDSEKGRHYNHFEKQSNVQHTSSGLGLSITSRIIALMGGTLKVVNQGDQTIITSFTIKTKTLSAPSETKDFARAEISEKVDRDMSRKLPLHILIAEDNEMSQVLLSSILLTMGYTCDIATNGAEAVAMAVEEDYDIIFMDIFMPEMGGIEATQKIRKFYMNKEFPIIVAVTANVLFTEKEKCFNAGMNDFITKPFNASMLQNLIVKWGHIKEMLDV